MKFFRILSGLILLGCVWFLSLRGFQFTRDVEAVAHRAQVAANVEDMLEYMNLYRAGLERHGMTSGHTALLLKTPANDLALLNQTATKIIERLVSIKEVAPTEVLYHVALDDIRGTIRELESPSLMYVWTKYWYLFLIMSIIVVWAKVKSRS